MNAVNRPGSLASSAALIASDQALRYAGVPGVGRSPGAIFPWLKLPMISSAAAAPSPAAIISFHHRPSGNAVPPPPLRKGQAPRVAPDDHREEAPPVGVIGDHQEVERTGELRRLAGRGG